MTEKEKEVESEDKDKKEGAPLPFCTTASAPEHHRSFNEDEPCDDGRSGRVEENERENE